MRTITISQPRPISGFFEVKHAGKRICASTAKNAGEAAAVALNYRLIEKGEYVIVGHDDVIKHIPESIRNGNF
jgi:hypothetical protein